MVSTLLKWRHQPPGESAEHSEEEETLGINSSKVTIVQPQENFLNNRGMERKQVVATGRTAEMQMSLASANIGLSSATVGSCTIHSSVSSGIVLCGLTLTIQNYN